MTDGFTRLVAAAKTGNQPAGLQDKIAKDAAKIADRGGRRRGLPAAFQPAARAGTGSTGADSRDLARTVRARATPARAAPAQAAQTM